MDGMDMNKTRVVYMEVITLRKTFPFVVGKSLSGGTAVHTVEVIIKKKQVYTAYPVKTGLTARGNPRDQLQILNLAKQMICKRLL
jgi:hypothetical protein